MRVTRIELAYPAWEADVLPLNYTRISTYNQSIYTDSKGFVKGKISPQHPTSVKINRAFSRLGGILKWSFCEMNCFESA